MVTYFEDLLRNLPGGTEQYHGKPKRSQLISRLIFEIFDYKHLTQSALKSMVDTLHGLQNMLL